MAEEMRKLGYVDKRIQKIEMCVNLVSFSILINGEVRGKIISERGAETGGPSLPLSLYFLCGRPFLSTEGC